MSPKEHAEKAEALLDQAALSAHGSTIRYSILTEAAVHATLSLRPELTEEIEVARDEAPKRTRAKKPAAEVAE